mgnify:CR=1 FL=1
MKKILALLMISVISVGSVYAADKKESKVKTTVTKKAEAPKKDLGKKPTPKKAFTEAK